MVKVTFATVWWLEAWSFVLLPLGACSPFQAYTLFPDCVAREWQLVLPALLLLLRHQAGCFALLWRCFMRGKVCSDDSLSSLIVKPHARWLWWHGCSRRKEKCTMLGVISGASVPKTGPSEGVVA